MNKVWMAVGGLGALVAAGLMFMTIDTSTGSDMAMAGEPEPAPTTTNETPEVEQPVAVEPAPSEESAKRADPEAERRSRPSAEQLKERLQQPDSVWANKMNGTASGIRFELARKKTDEGTRLADSMLPHLQAFAKARRLPDEVDLDAEIEGLRIEIGRIGESEYGQSGKIKDYIEQFDEQYNEYQGIAAGAEAEAKPE